MNRFASRFGRRNTAANLWPRGSQVSDRLFGDDTSSLIAPRVPIKGWKSLVLDGRQLVTDRFFPIANVELVSDNRWVIPGLAVHGGAFIELL